MKTIRFSVTDDEFRGIVEYAKQKGHGGVSPASTFAHFAVFNYMAKYGLQGASKVKAGRKYDD